MLWLDLFEVYEIMKVAEKMNMETLFSKSQCGPFDEISLKQLKRIHYFTQWLVNFCTCCQKTLWKHIPTAASNRNWTSSCTIGPKMDSKRTRQGFLAAMEARSQEKGLKKAAKLACSL